VIKDVITHKNKKREGTMREESRAIGKKLTTGGYLHSILVFTSYDEV